MGASKVDISKNRKTSNHNTGIKSPTAVMDMKDFQNCLNTCRFGKYQCALICVTFFQSVAIVTTINSFAYILSNAECDLRMTIYEKGILTAVPFIGMLGSGFIAGFLTDTFGRKNILLICLYGMFISVCVQGTSQTFGVLAGAKAVEGFSLHSWNFFLYAGGIFSLIAGILFTQFPESPKYDFAHGRYDRAFATLRKIYTVNTGMPPETFPHRAPIRDSVENEKEKKALLEIIGESLRSFRPLFKKPLISYLLIIVCVQSILMMGYNTMRLWYPQISTIVETYNHSTTTDNSTNLCMMLDDYIANSKNVISTAVEDIQQCIPNKSGTETYINTIIMGFACFVPYIISGLIINLVGKRMLVVSFMTTCTATCAGLYWATNSVQVAALFSIFVALAQTAVSLLLTLTLEVFPTSVRSFAVSMTFTTGRLATLIGNTVFPVLLAQSCIAPFISIASVVGFAAFLALFLPVVKK